MASGAFGLAITSDGGLPGLNAPSAVAGGRAVRHRLVETGEVREALARGALTPLGHDGEGAFRIDYSQFSTGGLLIKTASFGDHLICDGGRSVLSCVNGVERELWQRYVLGQVLPLTASVQGLEIFHASAVAVDDGVVALAGPSGAGKSSTAAALLEQGFSFFTDDVLALDARAFEVTAFPGTTLMGVPRARVAALKTHFAGMPWAADERKAMAPMLGDRRALPVRAFFVLAPDDAVSRVRVGPCRPNRLLATTFDGVSRTPERMRRLLRVGAMLAADGRAFELRYDPGSDLCGLTKEVLAMINGLEVTSPSAV